MEFNFHKTAAVTGFVAATAFLLYYLFKDDDKEEEDYDLHKKDHGTLPNMTTSGAEKMTRKDCLDLLSKIVVSQDEAKKLMVKLVKSILDNNFSESFEQLYQRILPDVPIDPLEARGLTLFDLDYLVERYQNDPTVRENIMKIMHMPPSEDGSEECEGITTNDIISVHEFMLSELEILVKTYKKLPNSDSMDKKAVTVALQAIISAKVQKKFGYTHGILDKAIMKNHSELSMNTKFARLTMQMQSEMAELTGLYN